ncbi:MAG TPA: aminotransferase class V-fold PLP-dependent enzyme, partial [Planctomycetota bacterium]|nr:aminotransferase class V-fold PLP-dependent enzyme [Planctomycetota bacterium]
MIYLDNAATTRMKPEVRAAMEPFLDREYGNASSLHAAGRRARRALEDARETVAACLGADPKEILFTAGATESNALAILGAAEALRGRADQVITLEIEHPSVLEAVARIEQQGWRVTRVPVDAEGLVDPASVANAVTPRTALISVMSLNNEVGSVQPLAAIRKISPGVVFHTDAAQSAGRIPVSVRDVDLLTFSAHKMHGPKGVGGLWVRKGTPLSPQLRGGGQEFQKRAGTENIAGIVGLAAAMKLAELGIDVDLMSLTPVKRSHSVCAQGGINTVNSTTRQQGDSEWLHFDDTVYGGDFLQHQPPVKEMTEWGPRIIDLMDRLGVPFNRTS